MPTRFKNASTVGSPQYPAAIAADMRRGQEPAGIMAERGIAKGPNVSCRKIGLELSSRLVTMHDADRPRRLEWRDYGNRRRR